MEQHMRIVILVMGIAFMFSGAQSGADKHPTSQVPEAVETTPMVLEKNEGEPRVRRPREIPLPATDILLKIDRKNGGSKHLVLFTELLPVGKTVPKHQHHGQDEIVMIQTSSVHAWLGNIESDVHAGGIIFIPADTWVSFKNTGNEGVSLVSIFSDIGFDEYLRCTSVQAGNPAAKMTTEEWKQCQHNGHVDFEGAAQPAVSK
jgi:quercetin dioxygenase-like cupin family protein